MMASIPWESLFGGALLGVSASLLLWFNGKVAGISGIIKGIVSPQSGDVSWRFLFVIGMIVGGLLAQILTQQTLMEIEPAPMAYHSNVITLIIAGLLVGIGTCTANGCTSGHGICGVGRFSIRSMVATGVFMLVAIVTVFVRQFI